MGGKPTIVGLIAVAMVMLGAGGFAGPRMAAAEIRVPLPGTDRAAKKRKRVQVFRPTRPSRNPTRVFANVTAAATSPEGADNSEAMVGVGTSSSASVAMALPARARKADDEANPTVTQRVTAVSGGTGTEEAANQNTSREEDTSKEEEVVAESDPAEDASEQEVASDAAADDAPNPDAKAEEEERAAEGDQENNETEPVETVAAIGEEAESDPAETASAPNPLADGSDAEESAPAEAANEDGTSGLPESATETDGEVSPEAVAEAGEEPVEAAKASGPSVVLEIDGEASPEVVAETGEEPVEAAKASGPSVVLEITPPPPLNAVEPGDDDSDGTVAALDTEDGTSDGAEIEVAALTPQSVLEETADPAPEQTSSSEAPADEPSEEEAATEETAPDATQAGEAADSEASETEAAEAANSETTGQAGETSETAEGSDGSEIIAVEPPPPPAHPVVGLVRVKLERPEDFKSLAKSDIKALTAFYGTYEDPPLWITGTGFSDAAKTVIATIGKADDWGLEAASFNLPAADTVPASDDAQADAEIALSAAVLSYARDAQIGRLTPSRVSKLFDQHPKLRDPKTVLTEIAASSTPEQALLSLHPRHAQFKRLQQALLRARDSAKATGRDPDRDRTVQLIVMNMERWRWLPRQLGNYYVWNNVPEYEVRVLKGGRTIYQEKTIVGQFKYATPFFSAPMRNIVVHPNWTVPPTIVREDIAPKLKGPGGGGIFGRSKQNVLRRFGLKVSYKGEPVNADTVDWNNVNIHTYTFTQAAGPANVLGQFKFNFPNKHAIYMHDTVQRELFSVRQRTLSHGCIRVHQPDRLAALLLSEDKGWSLNQVRSVVARNETKVISFKRSVPVHMTYFTARVDENGTLRDFADIYGIDNRMAQKLFTNPEYFPVPATPAIAETGGNTRSYQQTRQRRSSNNGLDGFLSGLFSN